MAVAVGVIYEVEDDDGDVGTTVIDVPSGFSLSDYGEFAAAMATFVDAMLHGKVINAGLRFAIDFSGLLNNSLTPQGDVDEIGEFVFNTGDGRRVVLNVPGLNESLVVPAGSDDIDQAQADVANLITQIENGVATTGGTISPSDIAEDDIVNLVTARERFRPSGRRS